MPKQPVRVAQEVIVPVPVTVVADKEAWNVPRKSATRTSEASCSIPVTVQNPYELLPLDESTFENVQ